MKQTAVEWLLENYLDLSDEYNTLSLEEIVKKAKEIENQQRGYSEEEVLNFTQTIIQQYKLGNTNIEQLDLLKETLQQFKNKKFPQQEQDKKIYSDEEAMEFFIEGYKQRAEKSDLIFDNASKMYAIHLFKQFKNK